LNYTFLIARSHQSIFTMSDPKIPELYKRSTPSWQKYQRELLWSANEGWKAPFNTEPD
jgi:hypothetical protein